MNRDAGIDRRRRSSSVPGTVRQIAVPPAARALSTLAHIDYEDAFLVATNAAQDQTAEQWARVRMRRT